MPNIPSRGATGSGLQPILPNRAIEQGQIRSEAAQFAAQFAQATYDMNAETEYQNAMNEHGSLLIDATAAANQETDPQGKKKAFDKVYTARLDGIAKSVKDQRRREEFDTKSRAQHHAQAVNVSAAQLKSQRAAMDVVLDKASETANRSILMDGGQTSLALRTQDLQDAAQRQVQAGKSAIEVEVWLDDAIGNLHFTLGLNLLQHNKFAEFKQRSGLNEQWEYVDAERDELGLMDAGLRSKLVGSGIDSERGEQRRARVDADRTERRADKLRRDGQQREQEFWYNKLNERAQLLGGYTIEDDKVVDQLERDGTLSIPKASRLRIQNAKLRDAAAKKQGDITMARDWASGAPGLDSTNSKHTNAMDEFYRSKLQHYVESADSPYAEMERLSRQAKHVYGPIKAHARSALSSALANPADQQAVNDAVNSALMMAELSDDFPEQARKGFSKSEWVDVKNIAEHFRITNDPQQAYQNAIGERVNPAKLMDVQMADFAQSQYSSKSAAGEERLEAVRVHAQEYFRTQSTQMDGVNTQHYAYNGGTPVGDPYTSEVAWDEVVIPREMLGDIIKSAMPALIQGDGKLDKGAWEGIFDDVRQSWGYSRMGDDEPGFRWGALEALVAPVPGRGWQPYQEDIIRSTFDDATRFVPRDEQGMPLLVSRADAPAAIAAYVDAFELAGAQLSGRDRDLVIDTMLDYYLAVVNPQDAVESSPTGKFQIAPAEPVSIGPKISKTTLRAHRNLTRKQDVPAYILETRDTNGDAIPIGILGIFDDGTSGPSFWQPPPKESFSEYQRFELEADERNSAGRKRSRVDSETTEGAAAAEVLNMGIPGADVSMLDSEDVEALSNDYARKYHGSGGLA